MTARDQQLLVAISSMMDKKFDAFSEVFDTRLKNELTPIRADIAILKKDVSELKEDAKRKDRQIAELNTKIDKVYIELDGKIDKVHSELDGKISILSSEVRDLRGIIENRVEKNIQVLAEGYVGAAKKYQVYCGYVDDLREDMALVKEAVAGNIEAFKQGAT